MNEIWLKLRLALLFMMITFINLKIAAQMVPSGKYDTPKYPNDRKIINPIKNSFDKSLSFYDKYIGNATDGKMYFGIPAELNTFEADSISFKAITPFTVQNYLKYLMVLPLKRRRLLLILTP